MSLEADKALIIDAAGGNKQAFAKFYKKYVRKVYYQIATRVNDRQTAEDITSQVFEAVLSTLSNYDPKYAVSTWVSAITRNKLADHFRAKYSVDIQSFHHELTGLDDDFIKDHVDQEIRVEKMIDRLPSKYQQVLRLRYLNGWKLKDIADELDLKLNNVKVLHHRAISKLKEIYKQDGTTAK